MYSNRIISRWSVAVVTRRWQRRAQSSPKSRLSYTKKMGGKQLRMLGVLEVDRETVLKYFFKR